MTPDPSRPAPDPDWWRTAVVYQIYPKSFLDSDGDGIGDLPGILSRLDHIAALGVDGIWLSPIFPSPQADGGYDVADYRDVDPRFGTLSDLDGLVGQAHELGLRVLLDIVPNHCSTAHPWFGEAVAAHPGDPSWRRLHIRRGAAGGRPPNNWNSVFGGPAWSPLPGHPGWWYLHLFDAAQPDLNWECEEVRADFDRTLRFWFDRGVDGFRIDVAHGLMKSPHYPDAGGPENRLLEEGAEEAHPHWDRPEVHGIWRRWRRIADAYEPTRVFVAEAWVEPDSLERYLRPDELHAAFDFSFLQVGWDRQEIAAAIDGGLARAATVSAPTTWVLDNHDVPRSVTRFGWQAAGHPVFTHGPSPGAPDLSAGRRMAAAMMMLMLSLPGSVYLYQGQELGLPEVLDVPDAHREDPAFRRTAGASGYRDGCRVPLPWSDQPPGFGFTSGQPWLPMPSQWGGHAPGRGNPVLTLTREALRLRRKWPALGEGDLVWIAGGPPDLLTMLRSSQGPGPDLIVALNTSDEGRDLPPQAGQIVLCSAGSVSADVRTVPGLSCIWALAH